MGVTRRMRVFDDPSLQIWFVIAGVGAALIAVGIAAFLVQIGVSIKNRERLRDLTGDPWGGRTLEWATSSPPPAYNFAFTPLIHDNDAWWDMKRRGYARPLTGFRPIHMPKNTGTGVVIAALSIAMSFGLIWYIWWLAGLSFLGIVVVAIIHTFNYDLGYEIPAEEVRLVEGERTDELASAGA
jgi:cytochrome o ubiquinol oxidase subunit 1